MDLGPGDHFAGLRIEGVAGRGGMGVVYRAVQPSLDRVVALKTIAPALAADPAFSARFVRESKAAAAVEHPNVLPIFSAGDQDGVLYIVMRYVDGPDLRSLIREHLRIAPDRAGAIVAQVAAALDAAHARGLVHRDVKPANVLLAPGDHAYLTDFGLTKRLHSDASAATHAGGWVGTLGYVAPEQIRGERVDARTDVYALGCVLFHALTGAPPYDRTSDEATLWAHLHDPPPPLPAGLPAELGDVIARATAKDREDRFPTAGDLGRAVLAAIGRAPATVPGLDAPTAAGATRVTPPEARPDAPPTAVTAAAPAATGDPARRGVPTLLPAAAAVIVAALVVAAVALSGGVGGPDGRGGAAQDPETRQSAPLRLESVAVGSRPNGVAVADGSAYVILPRSERLRRIDTSAFDEARPGPRIGRGALDVDTGYGALWVTTSSERERLLRIDLETGLRTSQALPDGSPVAVEAGENAIWVGLRGAQSRPAPRPAVLRIDPRSGRVVRTIEIERGVQDLAVGGGAVWITNRASDTVTRLDVGTGEQRVLPVGRGPAGVALGGGSVWVANSEESTVTRIDRDDPSRRATIGVAGQPRFVAYGGGSLWVTTFATSTLVRINGETGRPTGAAVDVGLNPTKLTVAGRNVYVVATAAGRLDRIGFGPG